LEQPLPTLEDLSCEGADAWHVQVKSRQARVGDFPTGRAAGVVIDAWLRHRERAAVQPGHVAAGLTVPRPEMVDAVLAGLDRTRACLVAGPSGAGKSAVAWMAAYVARHVLWYRVRRLDEQDVDLLLRLADAAGASPATPVGFVVDGVGVGALAAWDALQREAASRPGVLLLGSVRTEDLFPLATLADCAVVQLRWTRGWRPASTASWPDAGQHRRRTG
jgi:hypothetical protein